MGSLDSLILMDSLDSLILLNNLLLDINLSH